MAYSRERDGAVMALLHRPTDRIEVDKEAGPVARLAIDDLASAERDAVSVIRDHGQVTDVAALARSRRRERRQFELRLEACPVIRDVGAVRVEQGLQLFGVGAREESPRGMLCRAVPRNERGRPRLLVEDERRVRGRAADPQVLLQE